MKKHCLYNEKGITMMALIITIILMIILSATVAYTLNSSNGILRKKQQIENHYESQVNYVEKTIQDVNDEWGEVINKRGIEDELDER